MFSGARRGRNTRSRRRNLSLLRLVLYEHKTHQISAETKQTMQRVFSACLAIESDGWVFTKFTEI